MPTDHHTDPSRQEADAAAQFSQALVKSLNQATEQLPRSTQAALAASRAQALGQKKTHWHWALAASLLLALGMLTWHAPPPDTDAMALEILQTDDQLLNEIDLLESLAEVDET
ncbi:MAG TPA: DUF3619 family protein [Marinagarivorans sp.]|nr:DUF3619 family protein [Cellvibrionaceae bacterium]HMY41239.1 DUF3619 family protein [Marinagarivorans sp.]HNG60783.1 DUF3619 family protein [Cellvibrionaceae bacterium]